MSDAHRKSDAFNPQQPKIPGVPEASAPRAPAAPPKPPKPGTPTDAAADGLPVWVTLSIAGALILIIVGIWWSHRAAAPAVSESAAAAGPSEQPARSAQEVFSVGPGAVATTEELSKPWASKKFLFQRLGSGERIPATVVHLPSGGYWGFAMREPYGNCDMEWVTDVSKLQADYGFRAEHPMLVDPCTGTVFDLARYAEGPNGLVRGEAVHGRALRPPVAIEVRAEGNQVIAVRMEPQAAQ